MQKIMLSELLEHLSRESLAPEEDGRQDWYAIKVFHNKVFEVRKLLEKEVGSIEVYIPCVTERRKGKDGRKTKVTRQIVPSLMFVRTTDRLIRRLHSDCQDRFSVYSRPGTKLWEPEIVPERQLTIFRQVISIGDEGLELIAYDERKFSKGQKVKVTGGPFAGTEGRIVRIRGDHRLVVEIQGVCAVATSYIPKCFLEEVKE